MSHRTDLFNAVKQYLESQNWKFVSDESKFRFEYSMGLPGKLSRCRMIIVAEDKGIVFMAICPLSASKENLADVAEYLTRANFGLKSGNFELDYSDGEIRYKNYIRSSNVIPAQEDIEYTNDVCFLMFKMYGDGLVKNLMGFGNPEQDIAEAEA